MELELRACASFFCAGRRIRGEPGRRGASIAFHFDEEDH